MKKTLIAIAALAATSAFAQSSVTIYGIMDVGPNVVKSTNAAGDTTTTTAANASGAWASNRLGFMGTEDLGGGMKANFQYELGLGASVNGALGTTAARQSFAGLSGNFGSVTVGRQYNPAFSVNAALDAGAANNLSAGRTVYGANGGAASGAYDIITTARTDGMVVYTTPTMGGFTAKVSSSNISTDTAGVETGAKVMGGSLVYSNGPLMVAAGVNNVDKVNAAGDRDESIFGATYMLGNATLLVSTGSAKTKNAAGAESDKKEATQVGIRYPFGAISTFASYGTQTNTAAGAAAVKSTGYQAGAMYNFSKRTGLYAAYGSNKNDTGNAKLSELAIGVRHSF
jgi:predicted porin